MSEKIPDSKLIIERHPLKPFIPENARILMLGSFPPKHERWSMEFFYPNFQNDMWRIIGIVFFDDKNHFISGKRFDYDKIVTFCNKKGIAIFDTAVTVKRLQNNASDAFLEILEKTDLTTLLSKMPQCCTIISTGGKSAEQVAEQFGCKIPAVGDSIEINFCDRLIRFYRMPSSSRAYPMSIDKKAQAYSIIKTMYEPD